MNKDNDRYRPVKGWAEILYRSMPLITMQNQSKAPVLVRLKQHEYTPVGSWLPTEEFIHTFDIMELFQSVGATELYNIPRPIQPWDAINLCPLDPAGVKTLIVAPSDYAARYEKHNPQMHGSNELMLVARPVPFQSFRYPSWPKHLG